MATQPDETMRETTRHRGDPLGPAGAGKDAPAAELRWDRLTGSTSLVVPPWRTPKAANPTGLALEMPAGTTPCPFCPEQIDDPATNAGTETARIAGGPTGASWSALSLQNRWPHTLDEEASEVVLLSPRHDADLGSLGLDEAAVAVDLLLARAGTMRARGLDPLVFVNHGTNAGSSQPHPHGQVIGLPVADPLGRAEAAALVPGSCVLCETPARERLVRELPGVTILAPEAPRVDYDQLVVVDGHGPADPPALAYGIGVALRALYVVVGPVAYNLVLHLAAHPHAHVSPRTVAHSGYELAGISVCYVPPEVATERLAQAAEDVVRSLPEPCSTDAA